MKRAACLLIALLFVVAIPVLVRCDETLVNAQILLNETNASKSWAGDLKSGESISITLDVSGYGLISFHILDSHDSQLLDKTNIGTDGWQGQWTVPYDDDFEFLIELASSDQAIVTVIIESVGAGNPQQQGGGGGGFDPLPIVVVVLVAVAVLTSAFLIVRMRGQQPNLPPPPPPPPPEDNTSAIQSETSWA